MLTRELKNKIEQALERPIIGDAVIGNITTSPITMLPPSILFATSKRLDAFGLAHHGQGFSYTAFDVLFHPLASVNYCQCSHLTGFVEETRQKYT